MGGGGETGKGANPTVADGSQTCGGEQTVVYTEVNCCTRGTYIMLSTNVTSIQKKEIKFSS